VPVDTRNVQHFFDDLVEPFRVVANHRGQLALLGGGQVFLEQRIGLSDGCQRVADITDCP